MSSILDSTTNFLKLYVHHVGDSEVPDDYHLWSCLGMLAACAGDRVWYEKMRGKRLCPNLYIALLGPSAVGKGEAIDCALKFIRDSERVGLYRGKATAPALIDHFNAVSRQAEDRRARVFFVTPELSWSVGKGENADQLIKFTAEIYSGSADVLQEYTRTRGHVRVKGICLNWLAGTTREWLIDCVPREAISGGFFGRMVAVEADYDFSKRIHMPTYPPDYDEAVDFLMKRVEVLAQIEGPFTMTPDAYDCDEHWYKNRPNPADAQLIPAWKRGHDLVLKLAMILSLADGDGLVIRRHHIMAAQKLGDKALKAMPGLVAAASTTQETLGLSELEDYLKRMKAAPYSAILKFGVGRGMNAERVRAHISILIQTKKIEMTPSPLGQAYVWRGRRR